MGSLFFMAGLIVSAVMCIFAGSFLSAAIRNHEDHKKGPAVLWSIIVLAGLFVCWFLLPGCFWGYVFGCILGLTISFIPQNKTSEE